MPNPFLVLSLCFLSFFGNAQTANFTYQSADGLYCSPVTINFTQTCTGNPTAFIWNFSNGQISNAANPVIVFSIPGSYTVELTALFNTQAIKTTQVIVITPGITASLTADRNYICTPGAINFTASTTGNIASYEWNFGDGSPVVTNTSPIISHNFTNLGTYTTTVRATDVSGCIANSSYAVSLQTLPVSGSVSAVGGCIPAVVNFTAIANIPAGSTVTNYSYNFGDASPIINSTGSSISHTYTATGSYTATVTVTTSEGCTNSYTFAPLAFGTPPTGIAAYPNKLLYCGSETPIFIGKAANANLYFWDFGDGTSLTLTDTTVQHYYSTLGTKTITVYPYFNGCAGLPRSFTIDIVGVIAGFTYNNTCINKNLFSFTNTSQGIISSYSWNFGDASPAVSTANAVHTYSSQGSFTTILTVADSTTGCSNSTSAIVYSGNSILSNTDTSICRNVTTGFTLTNNQNNPNAVYNWYVVGLQAGPLPGNTLAIPATSLGNYTTNYVVINNGVQYCPDTAYLNHPILVRGPNLIFSAPASICLNNTYLPVNTSTPFVPADSVILWYWNYGVTNNNDSIYQPAPINYPGPGTYNIKLTAKDKTGCIDSLSNSVVVNPIPFLQIIPANDTLCFGQTDSLIAFHSDTLLWSPAALVSCTICDTIIINPTNTTLFIATANNTFNCSISDTAVVTVFAPFTAQAITNPVLICNGDSANINVDPPNKIISWTPTVSLSAANIYNPFVSPAANTTYTATLTDSAGCFSSLADVDVIVKTLPTVNAGPNPIYSFNTPFTITPLYSSNVISYLWTPAGTLSCTNCPTPNGTALQAQTYNIQVASDSGCIAKDTITIFVECKYANLFMPSAFTPNNDSKNDLYYPLTRGINTIKRFAIFNRYGQLLFEVKNFKPNDQTVGWNGEFKGQDQSMDTYVYLLEAVCDLGGIILKKDSFILLR